MATDSSDTLREIARRFREELWNTGDLAVADAVVAKDCFIHSLVPFATDFSRGPDALAQLVLFFHLAFSEIEMRVDASIVEADRVASRWTARARHTGDLLGVPATGRLAQVSGIDMLRVQDGKIVEGWVSWDALSLLDQLTGPEEGAAGAAFMVLLERLRED